MFYSWDSRQADDPVLKIVYRAMGAKIGQRIYWPGSGIYCPDPEFLEIGDDVVFGSRSLFITTDRQGSGKIVIEDGGEEIFFSYSLYLALHYICSCQSHDRRSSRTSSWDTRWHACSHGFRSTWEAKWDLRSRFNLDGKW